MLSRIELLITMLYVFLTRATQCWRSISYDPVSVCLSVRPSQAGIVSKQLNGSSSFLLAYPTLHYRRILVSPEIRYLLPCGTLSQTLDLEEFRHLTSTVADVVNLVRPTPVASLSHWASTFVYNAASLTQRVERVRLRQPRLVISIDLSRWRYCLWLSHASQ